MRTPKHSSILQLLCLVFANSNHQFVNVISRGIFVLHDLWLDLTPYIKELQEGNYFRIFSVDDDFAHFFKTLSL